MGVPADPNALSRKRDGKEWVKLRAPRQGPPPPWPIPLDPGVAAQLDSLQLEGESMRQAAEREVSDVRRKKQLEAKAAAAERAYLIARAREDMRGDLELAMWERVWHTPQAVVWEADGAEDAVALYVRTYLEASRPEAPAALRTLVRQQAEALLLTPLALSQGKYVIDVPLPGAAEAYPEPGDAPAPAPGSADGESPEQRRSRFKKLDGGESAAG